MTTSERLSLARELHDGIAQDLVALGYSLDQLLAQENLSNATRASLRSSRLQVDDVMARVRKEIFDLRSAKNFSLATMLREYVQKNFGNFSLDLDIEEVSLSHNQSSEIFKVSEEILRNIRAHSRATHIVFRLLTLNNRVYLQVSDNGIGGINVKNDHWGLTGIKERISAIGGHITIENLADIYLDESGVRFTVVV